MEVGRPVRRLLQSPEERERAVPGPSGGDVWSAYGFPSRLDVGSERKERS